MSTRSNAAYDDFAWFYARYWNEQYHSVAFPILERILLPHIEVGERVLDVCCGTGYLARLLIDRGFSVTGIDASREMIRQARRHAPGAEFRVADAASFTLEPLFDAAVSTFDSLNHILSLPDLEHVFRNVYAALKPGALFAFDMLLEEAYWVHWQQTFGIVRQDHVLLMTGNGCRSEERMAVCRITMFRLVRGEWR